MNSFPHTLTFLHLLELPQTPSPTHPTAYTTLTATSIPSLLIYISSLLVAVRGFAYVSGRGGGNGDNEKIVLLIIRVLLSRKPTQYVMA